MDTDATIGCALIACAFCLITHLMSWSRCGVARKYDFTLGSTIDPIVERVPHIHSSSISGRIQRDCIQRTASKSRKLLKTRLRMLYFVLPLRRGR